MRPAFRAVLLFASALFAVSAVPAQSPISESKEKLIGEMIAIMEMDQQFPKMIDAMLVEMEKTYPISLNAALETNKSLTDEQKASIKATASERFISFSQKFRKKIAEKIDFSQYLREAIYPLYDKIFTEQEIKDMILFYKTPTGKKLVRSLPELMSESNRITTEKFLPKIVPIVQELVEEEFRQLSAPPGTKDK